MRILHTPTHTFRRGVLAAIMAVVLPIAAAAQSPGDPIEIFATGGPSLAIVLPVTNPGCDMKWGVRAVGGVTLFAAASPGGGILGAAQQLAQPPSGDDTWCPGFFVNGPPPGTYWVAMVYGLVTTINVPLSAWKPVVIPGGCVGVPNPPALQPGQPVIVGSSVSVAFGGTGGCPHDLIEVEIGTAPNQTFQTVPLTGPLAVASVPAGDYYLRAYASNAAGRSARSAEVPIRVPGPCAAGSMPPVILNPKATVNGNTVSLSWSTTAPIVPTTFFQLKLVNPATGLGALDHFVLPPVNGITVPGVPAGTYRVRIGAGNPCGLRDADTDVTFTVP